MCLICLFGCGGMVEGRCQRMLIFQSLSYACLQILQILENNPERQILPYIRGQGEPNSLSKELQVIQQITQRHKMNHMLAPKSWA